MRWIASQTDRIDAVLGGDPVGDDLLDVAAIVHDIRSTYLPVEPLRRSEALAAFTQAHLDADGTRAATAGATTSVASAVSVGHARRTELAGRNRNQMLSTISGFVGTLIGKAVVGTALAAASVGGLHAADVVDLSVLPDDGGPAVEGPSSSGDQTGQGGQDAPSEMGAAGQQTAADKQAAAQALAEAVQEWTDCVAEVAAAQGDGETRATGAFDPRDTCGEIPQPGDFGLTDLPGQAPDTAQTAVESSPGAAAVPEQPGSNAPAGSGSLPAAPGDAPVSPPASTPDPTQPDAVPEEPGSNAPAGSDSAPTPDTPDTASPPTTDTPAGSRP
jgi:hypothetical protein